MQPEQKIDVVKDVSQFMLRLKVDEAIYVEEAKRFIYPQILRSLY